MSFMAKAAQNPPATNRKKARKTKIVEVFSIEPNKKVIPKIIKRIPAINATLAANFRLFFGFIK